LDRLSDTVGARAAVLALCFLGPAPGCGFGQREALILQIATDDALAQRVEDALQVAHEEASAQRIAFATARRVDATSFVVEGVEPAERKHMDEVLTARFGRGWTVISEADGRFVVGLDEESVRSLRDDTVKASVRVLERRLRQLARWPLSGGSLLTGHAGRADQVRIELPRAADAEAARRHLTTRGQLRLTLVENVATSREALLGGEERSVPPRLEVREGPGDEPGQTMFYLVRREALITDRDVKSARPGLDVGNMPNVLFSLASSGAQAFERATAANVNRRLAIVVDGVVVSAPTIQGPIGESGAISGRFTQEEAGELARMLNAGALPVRVTCVEVVGHPAGR
jgi:protein-export membrane protein SecD